MCNEQIFCRRVAVPALLDTARLDVQTVQCFQNAPGYPFHDKPDGSCMFSHLINRKYAVANQSSLCRCKLREDQTRTVAQDHGRRKVNGLEMFGLAWRGGDANFLLPEQGVDRT